MKHKMIAGWIPLFKDMLLFWISMYRFVKLLVVLFCSWKFHKAFLITERWTKKNLRQREYSIQLMHLKSELEAKRFFPVFNFEMINQCLEFLVVFLESKILIKSALKSKYSGYYLPFLADVVCVNLLQLNFHMKYVFIFEKHNTGLLKRTENIFDLNLTVHQSLFFVHLNLITCD